MPAPDVVVDAARRAVVQVNARKIYTKPVHALEAHALELKAGNMMLREGASVRECGSVVFMLAMLLNLAEICDDWNPLYGMAKLGYPSRQKLLLECGTVLGPLLVNLGRHLAQAFEATGVVDVQVMTPLETKQLPTTWVNTLSTGITLQRSSV